MMILMVVGKDYDAQMTSLVVLLEIMMPRWPLLDDDDDVGDNHDDGW